ncbi:hypothetical protein FISHEDRAFT_37255 [Fistulina hepatica ATCC 64428]|uniref:C3H1-type domain-containing protein n=1 Tax=Fistulina hepatica ATCC 64428 TaxID=1128425 RepID=A0A0D7AI26_9AGAR|nr:hypothetical protein FISHEDRAFT_37255 [Fistulina hepatica ATCC 64428]
MIFDPSTSVHLKPWLIRTLEPICDAEPGALAEYILALLKHNVPEPEMRKELAVQLDEFLEKECASFIDTLFTALRTKSYIPYAASNDSKPPDTGIPIPLDALLSPTIPTSPHSRKRSSPDDDHDGRAPAKGLRLSSDDHFSRYSNGNDRSSGSWSSNHNDSSRGEHGSSYNGPPTAPMAMQGMNGRRKQGYHPPDGGKRNICRDYFNNGYCARGATCKYSHGDDAIVPLFPMNGAAGMMGADGMMNGGIPFMPMFPAAYAMGGPSAAYDPNEALDLRPRHHSRAPIMPRIRQEDGTFASPPIQTTGELPVIQDLTPVIPSEQSDEQKSGGYQNDGRGRRMNGYGVQNFGDSAPTVGRLQRRHGDKTIVVEKIPAEKMTLEAVNDWFKRFGPVTNVAVDTTQGKALVSFVDHESALKAWKSEDAIFGNRFVRVFWYRPMEGHGQTGAIALEASRAAVESINKAESSGPLLASASGSASAPASAPAPVPVLAPAGSAPSARPRKPSVTATPTTKQKLAEKQQLLEAQIAEQKSLMASLATASPTERKEVMQRLRSLGEEMDKLKSSITTAPDHEQVERERLDKELELHAAGGEGEETTEELKAKLERLKAEARSLGITDIDEPAEPHVGSEYPPYRGGYRGRSRGRGYYRGRGGAAFGGRARPKMSLDNRPRKLIVKGVNEQDVQVVKDWYETTGMLDSVERMDSGDLLVSFKTRAAAEQACRMFSFVPTIVRESANIYGRVWRKAPTSPPLVPSRFHGLPIRLSPDLCELTVPRMLRKEHRALLLTQQQCLRQMATRPRTVRPSPSLRGTIIDPSRKRSSLVVGVTAMKMGWVCSDVPWMDML